MKFSLHFSNSNFSDAAGARRLAQAAEAAGFESLVVIEHVVWPTHYVSKYPYSPTGRLPGDPSTKLPDPLIWMAFALAVTERIKCMTGILILPQRNPVVLAKELATIDDMSGGRLELGIGVGWLKEEFEAIGVPFEKRGARTDEYIEAMRALWDGDDASYDGKFVNFKGMSSNPKPARGRVPIHIGGHSEAAARRAAKYGDGFFPATGSQVDIRPIIEHMHKLAVENGRDPRAIEITTGCPGAIPGSGVDPVKAVMDMAGKGVGRVVLPVTAFMTDGPSGAAQHANTFGGLSADGLEERLMEFGEKVIRKVE